MKNTFNILLGFILSSPFFLSLSSDSNLTFSRSVHDFNVYILTFPISVLILLLIPLSIIYQLTGSRYYTKYFTLDTKIILAFTLFFWLINLLFFGNHLKIIIVILSGFLFISIIHILSKAPSVEYMALVKSMLAWQLFFGAIALFSFLYHSPIDPKFHLGDVIPNYFTIYNFEQYYCFGMILCFGLYLNFPGKIFCKFSIFLLILMITIFSGNLTAEILLYFMVFAHYINIFVNSKFNLNQKYLKIAWLLMLLSPPIFFPFISWMYISSEIFELGDPSQHGLWARMVMHYQIIESLSFFDFLAPITYFELKNQYNGDPHHQFFNYWFYGGFGSMILTVLSVVFLIFKLPINHLTPFASLYFLSGTMLETLSHPFIMIQFVTLLALSYIWLSKSLVAQS